MHGLQIIIPEHDRDQRTFGQSLNAHNLAREVSAVLAGSRETLANDHRTVIFRTHLNVVSHFLSPCDTLIIHYGIGMSTKKNKRKSVGDFFLSVILAGYLAQDLLWLPFWQISRAPCHFGRAPTVVRGGVLFSHPH